MRRKAFASERYLITPHHHAPCTREYGLRNCMLDANYSCSENVLDSGLIVRNIF